MRRRESTPGPKDKVGQLIVGRHLPMYDPNRHGVRRRASFCNFDGFGGLKSILCRYGVPSGITESGVALVVAARAAGTWAARTAPGALYILLIVPRLRSERMTTRLRCNRDTVLSVPSPEHLACFKTVTFVSCTRDCTLNMFDSIPPPQNRTTSFDQRRHQALKR